MTIVLAVLLVAVLATPVSDHIFGYYHYAAPITDYEVEYVVADFHSWQVGLPINYGAVSNVTLLENGSIDVNFVSKPGIKAFANIPYFEHTENIKPGQTFVVMCGSWKISTVQKSDTLDVFKYTGTKVLKDPGYDFNGKEEHYMRGVEALNGTKAHEFFHIGVFLKEPVRCDYPDVIKWSVGIIKTDGREDEQDGWIRTVTVDAP